MLSGPLVHDLSGTCPHCHHAAHFGQFYSTELQKGVEDEVLSFTEELRSARCPSCQGFVIDYIKWKTHPDYAFEQTLNKWSRIFPPPVRGLPNEIPKLLRELFDEGRRVATQSDRAAAVLARALLQLTLREVGFNKQNLNEQIVSVRSDPNATSMLIEKLDLVRHVGNLAAHPTVADGNLLNVEPGEVEALFAAIEELFDVFFVRPQRFAEVKRQINSKLIEAGKKPI
jgi:hypothetical protein